MKLSDYIRTIGDPAARSLFNAKPATVKAWRLGYRQPSKNKAREIIAATGGRVTWDGIYPASHNNNPSG